MNKPANRNIIGEWFFAIILFLMLFFPTTFTITKIVLIIFAIIIGNANNHWSFVYTRASLIWISVYLVANFIFLTYGQLNGGDAYETYGLVYIVEPIIFTLFLLPLVYNVDEEFIEGVFFIVYISIILYILAAFFMYRAGRTIDVLELIPCDLRINEWSGYTSISTNNDTSLIFLMPYFLMRMFTVTSKRKRFLMAFFNLLAIVVTLLQGTRTVIVVIVIAFFISYYLYRKHIKKAEISLKQMIIFIVIMVVVAICSYIVFSRLGDEIRIGNLQNKLILAGDALRTQQVTAMIAEWQKNPVFGVGFGINAHGIIRSKVSGTYEYTYLAMLYQTGIVGTLIYFYLYYKIGKSLLIFGRKFSSPQKDIYLSAFIAFFSIMLANATNPYIASFDRMIFLFYPLALMNKCYKNGHKYNYI